MGSHANLFANSIASADTVLLCENKSIQWDIHEMALSASTRVLVKSNITQIIELLVNDCQHGDQVVIMSNGGFDNIHQLLIQAMTSR